MITGFFINILVVLSQFFLNVLPVVAVPQGVYDAIDLFWSFMVNMDFLFPITTLISLIAIATTVKIALLLFYFLWNMYDKLRGI